MDLSKIMTSAHLYYSKGLFQTWSECLVMAWKRAKLIAKMKTQKVHFSFIKADKSKRDAVATLSDEFFSYESKTERPENLELITYWDLEKDAFRACRIERLLTV